MTEEIIKDGFLEPTEEQMRESSEAGYIFGGTGIGEREPVNESGDWSAFLSPEEQQNKIIESNACTLFGTLECVEALAFARFGERWNKSERYVGAFSGMQRSGNDPHSVANAVHNFGLIDEELMPFYAASSFEELWDRNEAMKHAVDSRKFLREYSFKHDWVPNGDIRSALHFSPLGVAVFAWKRGDDGLYYQDISDRPTHWTTLIAATDDHMLIRDSYPPFIKKMRPDTQFKYIKRYDLEKQVYVPFWQMIFGDVCLQPNMVR